MASHGIARARRDDIAATLDAVRSIVRALRLNAHAVEKQAGIGGAQLFVLKQLADAPARSMNELAARTHTHQSSVSVVTTKLVERGLVTRSASPEDRRRIQIALSPRGRAVLRDAPATVQAQLVAGLRKLSPARRSSLARGLEAWLAAAKIEVGRAPPMFEHDEATARSTRAAPRRPRVAA